MAKDIFLVSSALDAGGLNNAKASLQEAYNELVSVDLDRLSVTVFGYNGFYVFNIFSKYSSEFWGYVHQLETCLDRCSALAGYMKTSPAEIDEADELYSRKRNNRWNSTCDSVADFFTGTKLTEEIKDFFTEEEKEETIVNLNLNWSRVIVSREEIETIKDSASNKEELEEELRALYYAKLKERFVAQDPDNRNEEYWEGFLNRSTGECSCACQSMALSSIGIDELPKDILSRNPTTYFGSNPYDPVNSATYGIEGVSAVNGSGYYSDGVFNSMITAYSENTDNSLSPVVLHYQGNSGGEHCILIIGKDSKTGTYKVKDPWGSGETHSVIISNGYITGGDYFMSHGNGGRIDYICQYKTNN